MTSVGDISLDLVVRGGIKEQLDKLVSAAKVPADKMGESLGEALGRKAAEGLGKAGLKMPEPDMSAVKKAADELDDIVKKAVDKALDITDSAKIGPVITEPKPVKVKAYVEYDTAAIEAEIEEYGKKMAEKAGELTREMREKFGSYDVPTEPMERLSEEINNTYFKLDLLQAKWQELSAAPPTDKINSQLQSVQEQIISTTKKLDKLEEKLEALNKAPVEPSKFEKLHDVGEKLAVPFTKLIGVFEKLTSPIRKVKELISDVFQGGKAIVGGFTDKIKSALKIADKELKTDKSSDDGSGKFNKLKKAASSAANVIKKSFGTAFGTVKNIGSKAFDSIKNGIGKLTAPVKKFGDNLRRAFKSVFLMTGIYAAFRAVKDGLLEAAKADEKFASSLNAVKGNLAIAFQPILQSVMPMLNTLMSGLASATKSIASFISGIFGKTYRESAAAAKKLQSVGKEAKKTALSMAGIDEMNVLGGSDSDDEKDSGGVDFSQLDLSEPELPDWAERLKDAIKNGDWAGVGAILAERVNAAFSGIDWDKISAKLNGGIRNITDGINAFVDNLDWGLAGSKIAGGINTVFSAAKTFIDGINWSALGKGFGKGLNGIIDALDFELMAETFAKGFNAAFSTIYAFVSTVDWKKLGKKLTDGLNKFVKTVDWKTAGAAIGRSIQAVLDMLHSVVTGFNFVALGTSLGDSVNAVFAEIDFAKAGETLSNAIKGVLDFLINFIETVDWMQIGHKIAEFITNIDFSGIASRFFELLGAAFGAAVSLVWGAIQDAVAAIGEYFSDKIEECGGNVILGIFKGILDALKGLGKWIKGNIFEPFINGFKTVFGIHSPSKIMAEMGGYIIDGLKNAISDGIKKVREVFAEMREKIEAVFTNIHEWFEEKFSAAWTKIKDIFAGIGDWFKKRWDDITAVFSTIGDWFSERFAAAWEGITGVFSAVGEWFSNRWDDIVWAFSSVGEWFGSIFSTAWDNIKSAFSSVGSWFGDIWSGIKEIFGGVGSWFADRFRAAYDNVCRIWNGITGFFSDIWHGLVDGVRDCINWVIDKLNGMIDAVEGMLNTIIDGINSALSFHIPDNVPVIGGKGFDCDIPHVWLPWIPALAEGGLATAPTLAMVGDNRNAQTDPEVIAPLSKLKGMNGEELAEIIELLRTIVELLKNGQTIELVNYLAKDYSELSREILKIVYDDRRRGGNI